MTASSQPSKVFVGLGSNLGNGDDNISRALAWLADHAKLELVRHTRVIRTAPWGVLDQPEFRNAVAQLHTELSPHALLDVLKRAEGELGRTPGPRWGPRVIDLDILLYGEVMCRTDTLEIPHPRLTARRFVVEQLLELEPLATLPPGGVPLRQFL
ncbi:MAG: 2-amino-4-hydroxy-6-hydroxymethyldihydropteridine diphosphokinase [Myxococcota bacterium]|nr:2-amino-4-hydroxy-6-hydroxymethyldihydropteridine diphosphokinase [Myxococcota bacterium]